MRISSELTRSQKQELKITGSLIRGLNMLSLPIQALHSYLTEVSMANPLLDIFDPCVPEYENIPISENEVPGVPDHDYEYSRWDKKQSSPGLSDDSERPDPMNLKGTVFEPDTLMGSLEIQLSMRELSPVETAIGREIIGNLDDSGYFVGSLSSICLFYKVPLALGEKVFSVIRSFSPRGIAAYDVYDALCLQVEEDFPYAEVTKEIICHNLGCLRDGRVDFCAHKFGLPEGCINEIFDYIRKLEPRPGNCDAQPGTVNYIKPDIVVKLKDGGLCLFVCGNEDNPLRINADYLSMMHLPHLTSEEKTYFRARLNEARSLINNVDVRCRTIQRFAMELVKLQSDFFRFGPEKIRPLTMQLMAEEMEVSISTVSRIVQEKYISTPWGMYPLKYLFCSSVSCSNEEGRISAVAVKQKIKEIISGENPSRPLTDEQICDELKAKGCGISRRTVTKYRQALDIPSQIERRQKAG